MESAKCLGSKAISGRPMDLLMPDGCRQKHRCDVKNYFQCGKPNAAIGKTIELPALKGDGTVFPMELSFSAGEKEDRPFVLATIRDVTVQKQRVRESKERDCPITDPGQSHDRSERSLVRPDGTEIPILKTVVLLHLDGDE